MPTNRQNGARVPVGSDPYALTPDLAALADSLNVNVVCQNEGAMLALTAFEGMTCVRLDLKGAQFVHVNGAWVGPSDHVVSLTTGTTTFENVNGGLPLRVNVRNGLGVLNGRVRRTVGTGTQIGVIPAGARPFEDVITTTRAQGASSSQGVELQIYVASTGTINATQMGTAPAWDSANWISLNMTWVTSLLA